jgi:hypothetical protein
MTSHLLKRAGLILALVTGVAFALIAANPYMKDLNYTFVIATALLHGHLGLSVGPSWLNELVPVHGHYYSVFPLGAVLSVLPLSALAGWGLLPTYPVSLLIGLLAGGCAWFTYRYTFARKDFTVPKRIMLALWLVAGTWFMTNLAFGGAWQLALGFAVLGQLAALYWSVVRPRPLLAGLGLAVAFGNRTEILLIAPVILLFLLRPHWTGRRETKEFFRRNWPIIAKFCLIPVILGLATLAYNLARFGSFTDFGYARIPGVLQEAWYKNGIFSTSAIPENAHQMLWQGWQHLQTWPEWAPTGWGGSILLASPFLLLLLRIPRGDKLRVAGGWAALVILTLSLWLHGNTGGWQYSYRYGLILLPWFLVLFVEYLPPRVKSYEAALWLASVVLSAFATYLFLGTNILR